MIRVLFFSPSEVSFAFSMFEDRNEMLGHNTASRHAARRLLVVVNLEYV
jgi:hypothetical protein